MVAGSTPLARATSARWSAYDGVQTSAVALQFVTQLKTVLILAVAWVLFPSPHTLLSTLALLLGLLCTFAGVAYYTWLKNQPARDASKAAAP